MKDPPRASTTREKVVLMEKVGQKMPARLVHARLGNWSVSHKDVPHSPVISQGIFRASAVLSADNLKRLPVFTNVSEII